MTTLKLDEATARRLYPSASDEFKTMLETTFGKEFFSLSIIERMKTLEDACRELRIDYNTLFKHACDDYTKAEIAITTFAKALREGKPASECWYYPYFQRSSGGGFSFGGYAVDRDCSCVGARLRVDTPEKAEHLGKRMLSYYKTYINGQ